MEFNCLKNHQISPFFDLVLALTYECQCSCVHCGREIHRSRKGKELGLEGFKRIINQVSGEEFCGRKPRIYFFGGEPLLYRGLFKLIKYSSRKNVMTKLDTNGYLLTKNTVKILKGAGLNLIGVSIDSSDSKKHNRLRGLKGCFEKAIMGIKNCLNQNLECYISTYATKENLKNGDLERIIILGKKLGVDHIRIAPLIMAGNLLSSKRECLDRREIKRLVNFRKLSSRVPIFIAGFACSAINKNFAFVSLCGDVQPCCYVPVSFGNVKDYPLAEILKKMWKHPLFNIKPHKGECLMNNNKFRKKYLEGKSLVNFPINVC